MKRCILLVLTLLALTGISYAANPASMTISCTISGTSLGVTISSASWTVSAAVGATVNSTVIKVSNSSGGLTESYKILASTTSNHWTLGNAAGPDKACLQAVLKTFPSASGTFGSEDSVSFANQNCSTTLFGDGDTNCGSAVSYASPDRAMFLKLQTPTSVSNGSETISLTITAY